MDWKQTVLAAMMVVVIAIGIYVIATASKEGPFEGGYEITHYPDNEAVIKITAFSSPEEYVQTLENALEQIQEQQEGVVSFITTEIKVLVKPKPPVPQKGT